MDLKRRNKWYNISFNVYGCLVVGIFFFGHVICSMEFSSHWSTCSQNTYFLAIRDIPLEQCKTECYVRSECQGANYKRVRRTCELFSADGVGSLIQEKSCVYIGRRGVSQTQGLCSSLDCPVCNPQNDTCTKRECPRLFPTVTTIVSGNIQSVHRRAVVLCKPGFIYTDGSFWMRHDCNTSGNWMPELDECIPVTCFLVARGTKRSGEYETFDEGSQKVIKIFCDFREDHGYTYVSKASFDDVTDLTRYYTSRDHVNVRHLRSDASRTQKEGKISVLTRYRPGTLSILLNTQNTGFAAPHGVSQKYIYLQLVPDNFIFQLGSVLGYNFEGINVPYTSCDANQHNYLVVHKSQEQVSGQHACGGIVNHVGCAWIENAVVVDVESHLPLDYFYHYSMHIGGCGVLLYSVVASTGDKVEGIALGLKFDL